MFKKISFQSQVLAGFILTFIIVFIVGIVSYFSIDNQIYNARWVNHSKNILLVINETQSHMINAEADQRGYMLTGFEYYLNDYKKEILLINASFLKVRALVADNETQTRYVDSLNYYASLKTEVMDKLIQGYTEGKEMKDPSMQLNFNNAVHYRNRIREYGDKISDTEYRLLATREDESAYGTNRTIGIILGGCFIISGLMSVLFIFIKRTFRGQKITEGHILEANVKLNSLAQENEKKNWFLTGAKRVEVVMRGEQNLQELSKNIIGVLVVFKIC